MKDNKNPCDVMMAIKIKLDAIQNHETFLSRWRCYMIFCLMENKILVNHKVRLTKKEDCKCMVCWNTLTPSMYVQCCTCAKCLCCHCYNNFVSNKYFKDRDQKSMLLGKCPNCRYYSDWFDDGSNCEDRRLMFGWYKEDFEDDNRKMVTWCVPGLTELDWNFAFG